jgi:hypothetical protein
MLLRRVLDFALAAFSSTILARQNVRIHLSTPGASFGSTGEKIDGAAFIAKLLSL